MSTTFRATSETDSDRLSVFLQETFGVDAQSPLVAPDCMRWKYWAPRHDWSGSRSYVLERDGNILAHGCIWPFALVKKGERISGSNVIDWAADPKAAGAGAAIFRRLCTLVNCTVALHGGESTKRVLPMLGFKPAGEMWSFVRPLRPLHQMLNHPYKNWKLPLRLVRNTVWSLWPKYDARGWTTREISPSELPPPLLARGNQAKFESERSQEFYEYVLRCPIARLSLQLLSRGGQSAGYFLLSFVPGQARIAEMWMAETDVDSWAAAYALAADCAREAGANEIVALCPPDLLARHAIARAGYRLYDKTPVNSFFTTGRPSTEFELAMIDGDESFQHHGHVAYAS